MKIFLPFLVVILAAIYLNAIYAYIYHEIGSKKLINPTNQITTNIYSQPQKNTFTYVALGDSLSAGVGSKDTYYSLPFQIAQKLSEKQNVRLVNLSVPGARSSDLLKSQIAPTIKEKPNLITIFIGINDIHGFVPREVYQKNLMNIITNLKNQTSSRIVIINIPYLGQKNLIKFPYNYLYQFRTYQFNEVIHEIAQKENIQVLDLYTPTKLKSESDPNFYSIDKFHPSEYGYLYWSKTINDNLNI